MNRLSYIDVEGGVEGQGNYINRVSTLKVLTIYYYAYTGNIMTQLIPHMTPRQ